MCCLTSTKFLNLNVVFTKKASKLGGKPVVHSYAVILKLLGLFPEKFQDFFQPISTKWKWVQKILNFLGNKPNSIILTSYAQQVYP